MKQRLLIGLSLVLAMSLSACGNSESPQAPTPASSGAGENEEKKKEKPAEDQPEPVPGDDDSRDRDESKPPQQDTGGEKPDPPKNHALKDFELTGMAEDGSLVLTLKSDPSQERLVPPELVDHPIVHHFVTQPYCLSCHGVQNDWGLVELESYDQTVEQADRIWARMHGGTMPPQGSPMPNELEISVFEMWLENGKNEQTEASLPSSVSVKN